MEFLSMIYTRTINRKRVRNLLENSQEYFLYRKNLKEDIYVSFSKEISVKVDNSKVELMYNGKERKSVEFLVNNLAELNNNKKVSIKIYNNEEKKKIIHLLRQQQYYFV